MKRRKLLIFSTLCVSILYGMLMIKLFEDTDNQVQSSVLLQNDEDDQTILWWIQAGVFVQRDSSQKVIFNIQQNGYDPVCIEQDGKYVVIVKASIDQNQIELVCNELENQKIDSLVKYDQINEQQLNRVLSGEWKEVMEEILSQS